MRSPKTVEAASKRSLISTQDKVDAIFNDYGITGVEVIPPMETNTISSHPKEFFAYTAIHVWHEGFLPFPNFLPRFLSYLGIAPIELSPNVYTYLLSLELMTLESNIPSLNAEVLNHLDRLVKLSNLNHQIFRANPSKKLISDGVKV